jgi:6-phosphogluconolactonase/glucosamine-6-phosphate isomerase/deaminase
MRENLFRHVNINPGNIHIPEGMACDPEAHCRAYEEKIHAAGGIDLQLLGIGTEGTSVSTSPHRRWPPARESKRSPPAPVVTTRFRLRSRSKPIYEGYILER